jgi:hypothetical protein
LADRHSICSSWPQAYVADSFKTGRPNRDTVDP